MSRKLDFFKKQIDMKAAKWRASH